MGKTRKTRTKMEQLFHCKKCSFEATNSYSDLLIHNFEVHRFCEDCSEDFTNQTEALTHLMSRHHSEESTSKTEYKGGMRCEIESTSIKCIFCQAPWCRRDMLRDHLLKILKEL